MAKQETIKWIAPERLGELDQADSIKVDNDSFSPTQFRTLYWENASQFHKLFIKLQEEKRIFISKK